MFKVIIVAVVVSFSTGCVSGLNSIQEREYAQFELEDTLVEEKSVGTAVALGFLPGGGSFYTRNYGTGVLNLLAWPLSILWDPISGSNGAKTLNYDITVWNNKREAEKLSSQK